jgi:Family of unknown function (DUF5946)
VPPAPRPGRGWGTIRGVSAVPSPEPTEACPGCGAVLALVADAAPIHPGASRSCGRLFEVTLRGLREEEGADAASGAAVRLADAAYDAQHPVPGDPTRLRAALDRLGASLGGAGAVDGAAPPRAWRTTIADVAADLDVIDLAVLVESWARSVGDDWTAATRP